MGIILFYIHVSGIMLLYDHAKFFREQVLWYMYDFKGYVCYTVVNMYDTYSVFICHSSNSFVIHFCNVRKWSVSTSHVWIVVFITIMIFALDATVATVYSAILYEIYMCQCFQFFFMMIRSFLKSILLPR